MIEQPQSIPKQLVQAYHLFRQHIKPIKGALIGFCLHLLALTCFHFVYVKPACQQFAQTQQLVFEYIHYPTGGKNNGYGEYYALGYCTFHTTAPAGQEPHEKRVGLWEIMGFSAILSLLAIPFLYLFSMLAGVYCLRNTSKQQS
jgi:hypothetical protein